MRNRPQRLPFLVGLRTTEARMAGRSSSSKSAGREPASRTPDKPASPIEDDNMRNASRAMPGKRDALPPGTLPSQTPDAQGDQNMDPVVQPGRGSPRGT